ncbi:MAG TPA: M1 family aminopeptidase [Chitinivibrionales bacterium]|nr:M1 family aminopeptidase [Chitinivibrionales bacterium]
MWFESPSAAKRPKDSLLTNDILRFLQWIIPVMAFFLCGCSGPTRPPENASGPDLSYTVTFYTLDSLHVHAELRHFSGSDSVRILFPPFAADNPVIVLTKDNIQGLAVNGTAVAKKLGGIPWDNDSVQQLSLPASLKDLTIDYEVTFPYAPSPSPNYNTMLPGRTGNMGYYRGQYIFCLPRYASDDVGLWRHPVEAYVSVDGGGLGTVTGAGDARTALRSPYEILFLQFAVNGLDITCAPPLQSGLSIISLSSNAVPAPFSAVTCSTFSAVDRLCLGCFPPHESQKSVFIVDSGSGLEGTYSFFLRYTAGADPIQWIPGIVAHECVHEWVGIRTGETGDPWWKEGTASYFGILLAYKLGMLTDRQQLRKLMTTDLSANVVTQTVSLSQPYVRQNLYATDTATNCIGLVYEKGKQANMILDKLLRQASGSGQTLLSKTGVLCSRYDHKAFTRGQFVAVLQEGNSADIAGFFSRFVDSPGVLDTNLLISTFNWLDSAGAFSPQ